MQKNTKTYEIDFSNERDRERERGKFEVGGITSQNNRWIGSEFTERSANGPWEKKSKFREMENFDLILELSKIMTYESRQEKRDTAPPPAERKNVMRGREAKPHCSNRARSCTMATNFPNPLVAATEIHCWGSREQQSMKLICWRLI